jgi:hypothetical protein
MHTPVLLNVFNRPGCTRKVFQQIRKARPKQLFISADGPRADVPGEADRCAEVRNIVTGIDWDCDCKTLFRDQNFGCARSVSGAITWLFESVDRGIILEDDTLPSDSFFEFTAALLAHYEDHPEVMHIAGTNITPKPDAKQSYLFSRLIPVWGWATWKRAWQHFDFDMSAWQEVKADISRNNVFGNMTAEYLQILDRCYNQDLRAWGPKWSYSCLAQNGLSIIPKLNLVDNIGYGVGAVHTKQARNPFAHIKRAEMAVEMAHPSTKETDPSFDEFFMFYLFSENRKKPDLLARTRHKLEKLFRRVVHH